MGRPERRIDPEAGPVQAFAAELRTLREQAGRPKYAALAHRTGKSQTALAEAAGGRRLPTWETVAAYVAGCRGDLDHWRRRWYEVSAQMNPDQAQADPDEVQADPDQARVSPDPPHADPDQARTDPERDGGPDPAESGRPAGGTAASRWPWRRVATVGGLVALGALVALVGVALLVVPALTRSDDGGDAAPDRITSAEARPADGGAGIAIADEADPKDSGCADDPGRALGGQCGADAGPASGRPAGVALRPALRRGLAPLPPAG